MSENMRYTFLPYLQQGLSTHIRRPDGSSSGWPDERRPKMNVSVVVKDNIGTNDDTDFWDISKEISLYGPGDIKGINPQMIIRTDPADQDDRFIPNYIPFIDFMDEDFPWRYTPAIPKGAGDNRTLRPWLFLITLAEEEFSFIDLPDAPNPVIRIKDTYTHGDLFPPQDQIWAWAHVQANKDLIFDDGNSKDFDIAQADFSDLLKSNPEKVISRIMCPRKLKENKTYYGLLIPSFEMGRLTGLGESIGSGLDMQDPAWDAGSSNDPRTDFPVYYHWKFTTSSKGDFEDLARDISPFSPGIDSDIGKIPLDISEPNHPQLNDAVDDTADAGELEMGGALKVPGQTFSGIPDPTNSSNEFYNNLMGLVNLANDFNQSSGGPVVDPIISIPLYGRWHAAKSKVDGNDDWLGELNLDPRHRVSAGLGAKVIRDNQETYLEQAWSQVGRIREANEVINDIRASYAASARLYEKYILPASTVKTLAMEQGILPEVQVSGSTQTLEMDVEESFPKSFLDWGFHRSLSIVTSGTNPNNADTIDLVHVDNISQKIADGNFEFEYTTGLGISIIKIDENSHTDPSDFQPSQTQNTTQKTDFVLTVPGTDIPLWQTGTTGSTAFVDTKDALFTGFTYIDDTQIALKKSGNYTGVIIDDYAAAAKAYTDPKKTYAHLTNVSIFQDGSKMGINDIFSLPSIMAAPVIDHPMYARLRDMSLDYLIPNFHLLPHNSTTLLELNRPFIESYFVGLNHEFSQELLWNEYPTDQRGSYFRKFWQSNRRFQGNDETPSSEDIQEAEEERDITPIHNWDLNSYLGDHPTTGSGSDPMLVLVVKADLIKKFPTLNIKAQKAKWVKDDQGDYKLVGTVYAKDTVENPTEDQVQQPDFFAHVNPDTFLAGFNLTAEEVQSEGEPVDSDPDPGWFFILEERAGDLRFGADVPDSETGLDQTPPSNLIDLQSWNKLNWGHIADSIAVDNLEDLEFIKVENLENNLVSSLEDIDWSTNSANMAYILFQPHVKVQIHANQMIK